MLMATHLDRLKQDEAKFHGCPGQRIFGTIWTKHQAEIEISLKLHQASAYASVTHRNTICQKMTIALCCTSSCWNSPWNLCLLTDDRFESQSRMKCPDIQWNFGFKYKEPMVTAAAGKTSKSLPYLFYNTNGYRKRVLTCERLLDVEVIDGGRSLTASHVKRPHTNHLTRSK